MPCRIFRPYGTFESNPLPIEDIFLNPTPTPLMCSFVTFVVYFMENRG